jgi:hypothetical protein
MTQWSPDTCGCSINYSDDGSFTFSGSVTLCPRHAALANTAAHLSTVLAENQKKNNARTAMANAVPTARTGWSVDQATGVVTIKASTLPNATALANLKAQFPDVTFVLDTTLPPDQGS